MRFRKIAILFLIILSFFTTSLAAQEDILESQSKTLNIKGFVSEANKYTKEVFEGVDANDLLNSAIRGDIDNKTIFSKILNLFGKEIKQTIGIMRKYYNCHSCT